MLLAGRGDIKHLYDSLDAARGRLKGDGNVAHAEAELALRELESLDDRARRDLFGRGSIFAKAITRTLSARTVRALRNNRT